MTKNEFTERWLRVAGFGYNQKLEDLGFRAVACQCKETDCPGWEIVTTTDSKEAK